MVSNKIEYNGCHIIINKQIDIIVMILKKLSWHYKL
jgi:hypothetical protein